MGTLGLGELSRRHLSLNHYIVTSFSPAGHVTTHLHSNDGIDEEQHGNEQADIWQSLKTNIDTG